MVRGGRGAGKHRRRQAGDTVPAAAGISRRADADLCVYRRYPAGARQGGVVDGEGLRPDAGLRAGGAGAAGLAAPALAAGRPQGGERPRQGVVAPAAAAADLSLIWSTGSTLLMVEISVLIPTYLRPQMLQRAIGSCLAQEGIEAPFEIVVVD